jgi:signal transduction histidine kinase
MISVNQADDWRKRWADTARRIAAAPQTPAVAGALLGLLAVTESVVRAAVMGVSAQLAVVLCLLALSTTLPLALLRPVGAAVAVSAASVLSLAFFHTLTVAGLGAQLIVLYRFGRDDAQRNGAQLLAGGLSISFLVLALTGPRPTDSEAAVVTVVSAALAPAAVWVGIARRARADALMQTEARHVIAGTLVEHTARGERARIARELHDIVAHHISIVAVQAETARLTTPGMPAAGAQRLSAIGDTARAALTEMRRLLGVLREDTRGDAVDRRPQPDLRQLNDLLDAARDASGTGTRLILRGPPVSLDPAVELTAYRIAQEALTNARRHAPGAAVDVELLYTDDTLRLRIRDNGPGPLPGTLDNGDSASDGHGLLGMRERAAAVGGRLLTGPAVGGGFLVEATLPAKTGTLG